MGRFGVILVTLRDRFGIVLASFWCRFGVVLNPLWGLFSSFLALFFGNFWAILWSFCGFLVFWEVDCNIKQNDAREGKKNAIFCQNSPSYG